jgi:lipoyl-dependent peroxiredoxin
MKFTRQATANWQGTGKEGKGTVTTESKALDQVQSSFKTRFEQGVGTNPEELIAAAHASCFSMKLSFVLNEMGFTASNIDAAAKATFEDGAITQMDLEVKATVPTITAAQFQEAALNAKENCPISKSLTAAISMSATLV